jgi:hypothetical protein
MYANVSSAMALYFDTTSLYRDPAAWYHAVIGVDTTQATSTNRVKMYINGVQITAFASSTYPAQNTNLAVNGNVPHAIGNGAFTNSNYFDGYLSEVQLIDGQQLTPNSFGTFNSYGVWQPITYGGSYGTNGFYLPFTNSLTSVTASYLVVAGGGSGGNGNANIRVYGGGGAGGLLAGSSLTLNKNSAYTVTVGAGGAGQSTANSYGNPGTSSSITGVITIGGSSAGTFSTAAGGSGGGGGNDGSVYSPNAGTAGQGNTGGTGDSVSGGGGGGAGAVGGNGSGGTGGTGGAGTASSITGTSVTYAGGGGGGGSSSNGAGGAGGGSTGSVAGTANTGGGSGGTATNISTGNGGSGIVIISYAGSQVFTGGTVTSSGGNTIHKFTSSGTLTGNAVPSLGTDYSPQGNNWTTNNISTTSGSTYDSMTDVPTLTSATVANYCVLNPLNNSNTLSNGNLTAVTGTNTNSVGTLAVSSGKWYFEATVSTIGGSFPFVGIVPATYSAIGTSVSWVGQSVSCWAGNGLATSNGDVIGFAFDLTGLTFSVYKNGTLVTNTSYFGNNTVGGSSISSGYTWVPAVSGVSSTISVNFGQQPFVYTPPTGYVALNTYNL